VTLLEGFMVPMTLSLLQLEIFCRSIRVREGKMPVVVIKVVVSKVVVIKKAVTGKLMLDADIKVLRYIPSLH
jgi:hypothetical protein